MLLTNSCIRKILTAAIKNEILILSANPSAADVIYAEIKYFAKYTLNLSVVTSPNVLYISGLQPIVIATAERWNNKDLPHNPFMRAYKGDFDGMVLVTDKSIANILEHCSASASIRFLPIDLSDDTGDKSDKIIESFQAKLNEIRYSHALQ